MKRLRFLIVIALLLATAVALGQMPRINFFRSEQRAVQSGAPVTLSWATTGARTVSMEWHPVRGENTLKERRIGLPATGAIEDHPLVTTTYVLNCTSELGFVCASSSVTVLVK